MHLIDAVEPVSVKADMIARAAKPQPLAVLARAFEQRGRMEPAAKAHADDRAAEHRHPAPVLARSALLFEMAFVEVKIMPFERAVPAVLEVRTVKAREQAIGARRIEFGAGLDFGFIGEAVACGDRAVDPGLDCTGGGLDREIPPPRRRADACQRHDPGKRRRGRAEPQEGEQRHQDHRAPHPAIGRLLFCALAHALLAFQPFFQAALHQGVDVRSHSSRHLFAINTSPLRNMR